MADTSNNNDTQSNSKKYWLRALIIIAIGIPVLIELNTFLNLVYVQFWGDEAAHTNKQESVAEVREFTQGDTLYADSANVITLQDARVVVSPTHWRFLLSLAADSTIISNYQIHADSLGLNSGEILVQKRDSAWQAHDDSPAYMLTESWNIPNGDLPNRFYMTLQKKVSEDSIVDIHKTIRLGSVPVRYDREQSFN